MFGGSNVPGRPCCRLELNPDPLGSVGRGCVEQPRAQESPELAPGLSLVGGSQNLRFYWKEFVNEVDVLVFMVDSADRLRLPWARQELHKLLDKDPDLPVVVVANKQVRARLDRRYLGGGGHPGEGRRPGPTTWGTRWRSRPHPLLPVLFPHPTPPSCLPSLAPPWHLSSWSNENRIIRCPLDARCGSECHFL